MNYKKDVIENFLMDVWFTIFCLALITVDINFFFFFLSKKFEDNRTSIIIFYSIFLMFSFSLFLRNNFLNVLGCFRKTKMCNTYKSQIRINKKS